MVLRGQSKNSQNRCDWEALEAQEPSAAVEVPQVTNYFKMKSFQNTYDVFALRPNTGLSKHLDYIAIPVGLFAVFL